MSNLFPPVSNKRLLTTSFALLGASLVAALLLPGIRHGIFSTQFLPHTYCYLNNGNVIALHVTSDGLIWLSYVAISLTLVHLVYRTRREVPFAWMFLAFGAFIVTCGFTHFMEIIVLWKPMYWLAGGIKAVTAFASAVTAVALPLQIPAIHRMLVAAKVSEERRSRLEEANQGLSQANQQLQDEIRKRIAAEESLRNLSGSLLQVQDNERRRLARELHDGVGQLLTGAALCISAVRRQTNGIGQKPSRLLTECADSVNESLQEVRTLSYLLHPPMLDETGLGDALRWYIRGFAERSGVDVKLDFTSDIDQLSIEVRTAVFRIVQESLTNIHRHSGSRAAEISLHRSGAEIQLYVRDHGRGIPPIVLDINGEHKPGVGIPGMRERVAQLKGQMRIQSDQKGTILEVSLPVREEVNVQTAAGV